MTEVQAYSDLYSRFFSEIDAFDNGIPQYSNNFYDQQKKGSIKQNFYVNLALGQLIPKLNTLHPDAHDAQMQAFLGKASEFVWQALEIVMVDYFRLQSQLITDFETINFAMSQRHEYHPSGQILVVMPDCHAYRQGISQYESSHPDTLIKFIVYPNNPQTWSIRTIGDQFFKNRRDLLPFGTMRNHVSKPEEVEFIHKKLFIGSADSTISDGH